MDTRSIRNGKGHRSYRRQARILKRRGLPCAWCGEPIDYTAHYNHPMAFTADHVDALNNGGSLNRGELQPMHRKCNAKKLDAAQVYLRPAS